MEQHQLTERSKAAIDKNLDDYFIYELDENPVACVALRRFPEDNVGEIAHLYVNPLHGNRGIGQKLAEYAENIAAEACLQNLITLSTQAFAFFQNKAGFAEGTVDDLPVARRAEYEAGGRQSKILIKHLTK